MNVGALRHRVTIEEPTDGPLSPSGGQTDGEPTQVATGVPMAIEAIDVQSYASERIAADTVVATTMYTVKCRYRDDFTTHATLVEECHGQRRLQILSRAQSDRGDELTMLCVERLA